MPLNPTVDLDGVKRPTVKLPISLAYLTEEGEGRRGTVELELASWDVEELNAVEETVRCGYGLGEGKEGLCIGLPIEHHSDALTADKGEKLVLLLDHQWSAHCHC